MENMLYSVFLKMQFETHKTFRKLTSHALLVELLISAPPLVPSQCDCNLSDEMKNPVWNHCSSLFLKTSSSTATSDFLFVSAQKACDAFAQPFHASSLWDVWRSIKHSSPSLTHTLPLMHNCWARLGQAVPVYSPGCWVLERAHWKITFSDLPSPGGHLCLCLRLGF